MKTKKVVKQLRVKGKLPEYVYLGLGMALSNACDELEDGKAISAVFSILTPTGMVCCTLEKIFRTKAKKVLA